MSRNFNISLVFFDDLKQFLILRYTPLMRHKTPLFKLQNPFSVWRYGGMVTVLFGRARIHTYKVLLVTMNCWHIFLVLTVTNWTKMKWKMWRVEKLNSSSWNRDTLTDTHREKDTFRKKLLLIDRHSYVNDCRCFCCRHQSLQHEYALTHFNYTVYALMSLSYARQENWKTLRDRNPLVNLFSIKAIFKCSTCKYYTISCTPLHGHHTASTPVQLKNASIFYLIVVGMLLIPFSLALVHCRA